MAVLNEPTFHLQGEQFNPGLRSVERDSHTHGERLMALVPGISKESVIKAGESISLAGEATK